MKIFISWAGDRSRMVGEFLCEWIRDVIQAAQPWMSTKDLDRGTIWFTELNEQLSATTIGIICLTAENKNRPWILFEAGALAKGLTTNRVCTFLIDLQPRDLEAPLSQFNHTSREREQVRGLIGTINKNLGQNALDARVLERAFEKHWPNFEERFQAIIDNTSTKNTPSRTQENIVSEILETTRSLQKEFRTFTTHYNSRIGMLAPSLRQKSPGPTTDSPTSLEETGLKDDLLARLLLESEIETHKRRSTP